MKPHPQKIQEMRETLASERKKALQSFLGLTNYMKRFIHDYSTLTHHLRQEDKDYICTETHKQAFKNLKQSLSSESCVSYFENHKETFVYTDASPHGISAMLLQKLRNQENCNIVAYSSRALTSAEKNYSQLERECLAIVNGCEKNRLYLFGRPFTIYSDDRPIVSILNKPKTIVPLSIELTSDSPFTRL